MKTIQFNTGRRYTGYGQRIVATLHDDGVVTFHDIDRMITGELEKIDDPACFNQTVVMEDYDHNHYQGTSRAWADGMTPSGINSKWKD